MSQAAVTLQAGAEALSDALPPLLAEAQHLAAMVMMGEHGRRRAGMGDEFWQYRPAQPGDSARMVDWRRSARSDQAFVREREWQAAQSVAIWADGAQSMGYRGTPQRPTKAERARVLALALGILALRGGERVGLAGQTPRAGRSQILPLAMGLLQPAPGDYGTPPAEGLPPHGRLVLISDFLGPLEPVQSAALAAADAGIGGVILQVLDPSEEDFPFAGRVIFESMGGGVSHQTLAADDLRPRYLERLAARKAALQDLAARLGWHYGLHHSDSPAASGLLFAYQAVQGGRG